MVQAVKMSQIYLKLVIIMNVQNKFQLNNILSSIKVYLNIMLIRKKIGNLSLLLKLNQSYHNLYDVLELDHGASQQEIKSKYYELAKKYHPDAQQYSKDPNRFIKIKEAYEVLGDQSKRKDYDNSFYSSQNTRQYNGSYETNENYYQEAQRKYRHYHPRYRTQRTQYQEPPSLFTLLKRSPFTILFWCAYVYMAVQVVSFFLEKMRHTGDMQFRRAMIQQSSPSVIERRKKLYAKEMQEKGIKGQLVDLKYRVLTKESTRSKQKRTESLISLKGVEKQKNKTPQIVIKPEYI